MYIRDYRLNKWVLRDRLNTEIESLFLMFWVSDCSIWQEYRPTTLLWIRLFWHRRYQLKCNLCLSKNYLNKKLNFFTSSWYIKRSFCALIGFWSKVLPRMPFLRNLLYSRFPLPGKKSREAPGKLGSACIPTIFLFQAWQSRASTQHFQNNSQFWRGVFWTWNGILVKMTNLEYQAGMNSRVMDQ